MENIFFVYLVCLNPVQHCPSNCGWNAQWIISTLMQALAMKVTWCKILSTATGFSFQFLQMASVFSDSRYLQRKTENKNKGVQSIHRPKCVILHLIFFFFFFFLPFVYKEKWIGNPISAPSLNWTNNHGCSFVELTVLIHTMFSNMVVYKTIEIQLQIPLFVKGVSTFFS